MTNIASVGRRMALAAAAGLAVTTVIASTASAAAAPWTVASSANAGATTSDKFLGVSMLDNSHGFAVGAVEGHSIIESWNGTGWTLMTSPNPDSFDVLNGVTAISPTDAWAVGEAQLNDNAPLRTLIEHFDGTSWTVVPSPSTGVNNQLNAVAARSSSDVWAVGQDGVSEDQPIIEHWNGTSWSVVPGVKLPKNATALLTGVAVSPNGDVWAVGGVQKPVAPEGVSRAAFIERLSGGTWTSLPVPATVKGRNVTLRAVSAASANDVWAVGDLGGLSLAEHWDGTAWSIVPTTTPSGTSVVLKGVAAVGPHDAWFVGDQSLATISMQSDGTTSTIVTTPSGAARGDLSGVSAVGHTLYAVGSQINDNTTFQSFTLALTNAAG